MAKDRREYYRRYNAQRKANTQETPCVQPVENTCVTPVQTAQDKPKDISTLWRCVYCFLLGVFVGCNCYFLVCEQVRFYKHIPNYTENYALFVAMLSEMAAIILSFSMAASRQTATRLKCGILLLLTICAMMSAIYLGAEMENSRLSNKETVKELLKKEVERMEKKESEGQTEKNPRLGMRLKKASNDLIAFLEANPDLQNVPRGTITLSFIRILAIFWNVFLCSLIGQLWHKRNSVY